MEAGPQAGKMTGEGMQRGSRKTMLKDTSQAGKDAVSSNQVR
jgi:hypothetical protein